MKLRIFALTALLGSSLIFLSLPAAAEQAAPQSGSKTARQPDKLPKMTNQCGFGDVYDWKAINDHSLIVWFTNHNDKNARVIELDRACPSLMFEDTIAFKTRDRFRVCSFGGDAVFAGGERCSIGEVRAYDPAVDRPKSELKPKSK
jgi:hypothetical protein